MSKLSYLGKRIEPRETRFTRLNRRACSQAIKIATLPTVSGAPMKSTKRSRATPEKAIPSWSKMKLARVNSPELETLYGMMQATNSLKSQTFTKDDFI